MNPFKTFIPILFFVMIMIHTALANDPVTIFHQGYLTDESGEPVEDGTYIFTFHIYDAETGDSALWTENHILQVNDGVFNAHLGEEELLDLPFDERYWIGVAIDGGDELEPRMPMSAVPYAMHALSVKDGVITGAKLDPEVLQAGDNISVELDENNNFVISADTPEEGLLSVSSDSTLKGDGTGDSPLGLDFSEIVISEENLETQSVTGDKIDDDALQEGTNVSIERDGDTQNLIISADTPDGGITSVTTDETLEGDGTDDEPLSLNYEDLLISEENLEAESVTGEKLSDSSILSGDYVTVNRDSDNNFVISADAPEESPWNVDGSNIFYNEGNVGIGTDDPGQALDVNGTIMGQEDIEADGELRVNANASVNLSYIRFRDQTGNLGPRIFHSNSEERIHVRGITEFNVDGAVRAHSINTDGDIEADGELRANANASTNLSLIRFRDQTGNTDPRILHNYSEDRISVQGVTEFWVNGVVRGQSLNTLGDIEANGELRVNANASTNLSYIRFGDQTGTSSPRIFHHNNSESIRVAGITEFNVGGEVVAHNINTLGDIEANGELRANANASANLSYIRFRDQTGQDGPRLYHRETDNQIHFTGMDKVTIFGDLSASGSKNFVIDHPEDPANKYLYHAAIESDERFNKYSGNITTDSNGRAVVELPSYVETINRDFRYNLTVIGQFAQAIVGEEVSNDQFIILTDEPNVKVSWELTGVRNDPYARENPFEAEVDKAGDKQGTYLIPSLYNQPETQTFEYRSNQ